MQHEQGLKNVMTCLGTRGEIGLEKVLFGKINLGRPVRLKWFNFESDSVSCFSHIRAFVTPWTVAHQAHLSMEFSRQEYWSGIAIVPVFPLTCLGLLLGQLKLPV